MKKGDLFLNGKYRMMSKLGKGGFGETWKVKDTESAKGYAAKFEL